MRKLSDDQIFMWKQKIETWQRSYLSILAWCKENHESYDKFQYWRAKLKLSDNKSICNTVLSAYPDASKIYLHLHVTNQRKSFDNLRKKIDESFLKVEKKSYFVFLGKRRQILKVFCLDSDSEIIWCKRLNRGTFPLNNSTRSLEKQGDFYILL
jgi:hypothetical protein